MLNFDVAAPFKEKFYSIVKGGKLKLITCDITCMSWALPESTTKNNTILTNTNYCTEAVFEQIIA